MKNKISKSEIKTLVNLLGKLEPGYLPTDIFYAVLRLVVTPTYLAVPLYDNGKKLQVQLIKRGMSDPHWAGLLHLPGTVIIATDKTIEDTYSRLIKNEISDSKIKIGPIYAGYVFDTIPRGREVSIINYVLLEEAPRNGKLYDVDNLPKNIITTEIKRVVMAVEHYRKNK